MLFFFLLLTCVHFSRRGRRRRRGRSTLRCCVLAIIYSRSCLKKVFLKGGEGLDESGEQMTNDLLESQDTNRDLVAVDDVEALHLCCR